MKIEASVKKTAKFRRITAGKNLLFAELIIVILFFSLAAAGCVTLFAEAYADANRSRDLTNAVIEAQNAAEAFKAAGGDFKKTIELFSSLNSASVYEISEGEESFIVYKTVIPDKMIFLYVDITEADGVAEARISVKNNGGDLIYELTAGVMI